MAELMRVPPSLQDLNLNPHPFRRGPMYSAYAELREWKLRTKNKRLPIIPSRPSPSPSSIPAPSSSTTRRSAANSPMVSRSVHDLSMAFRKENKRPPSTPRHDYTTPFRTPPPATPKHEPKRAMTNMRGSASRVFSMRKSYNCLKELKEYSAAARSGIDDEGEGIWGGRGGWQNRP